MSASRASWRSSRIARAHLDVADQRLQARRERQGVEHHCIVKAVFPAPGAPPMSVTSPGPISILRKLARADRIEGRRLARSERRRARGRAGRRSIG